MQAALARVPAERGALRAEILINLALASNWGFADAGSIRRYAEEALALAKGLGREDLAIAALSGLVVVGQKGQYGMCGTVPGRGPGSGQVGITNLPQTGG